MTIKMAAPQNIVYIFVILFVAASAYPWHASCKIEWNFSVGCSSIQNRIVEIIKHWAGPENCAQGGERCLYSLVSQTASEVKATHKTPTKGYVDDLTFQFEGQSSGGCTVKGLSRSQTWYAVLDYGTNYCNLHNLITGADLDKDPAYKETTSDTICTQYSLANCDKY